MYKIIVFSINIKHTKHLFLRPFTLKFYINLLLKYNISAVYRTHKELENYFAQSPTEIHAAYYKTGFSYEKGTSEKKIFIL
jgi:hypothetical protein